VDLTSLSQPELVERLEELRAEYAALAARGLSLNLTRGKPSAEQLDLAESLANALAPGDYQAADGTDCRNYGGLKGLPELRKIFAGPLGVPADRLLALGNSSLELMHETLIHAVLFGVPGSARPWRDESRIAFLCPVPGYDRHFALCEKFGIEMISVPMTDDGPDMAEVERLAAADPAIKGIWCVPLYSNPTGARYSDETVRRLATMPTAAPDFRLFWDNAYAVHHLTEQRHQVADVLALAEAAGHADRPFVFGSTSKITWAGSGVAFFGGSQANIDWLVRNMEKRTIGPDKINQLRHVRFLQSTHGVLDHMELQRKLLRPKFDLVLHTLAERLTGIATWSDPEGGYFVSLDVPDGCAARVVTLAKEAGIALTPAGATFPHGKDPRDSNIRLAPTFPSLDELAEAVAGLTVCVELAAVESLLDSSLVASE
jgi:DNA-binding transcriptional MocR family regulator